MKKIIACFILGLSLVYGEVLPHTYSNYQYDPSNEMEYFQFENEGILYTFMKLNIFSDVPEWSYNEIELDKMRKDNASDWRKYVIVRLDGPKAEWKTFDGVITIISLNKSFNVDSKILEK